MDIVKTEIEFEVLIDDNGRGPEILAVYKKYGDYPEDNLISIFTDDELSLMLKNAEDQNE